jgi:hypothetical protein
MGSFKCEDISLEKIFLEQERIKAGLEEGRVLLRVVKYISVYDNSENYGLVYAPDMLNAYHENSYALNPITIWSHHLYSEYHDHQPKGDND